MRIKVNFTSETTQYIFNKFIVPLFQYKPYNMGMEVFIDEHIFHLSERSIREYRVLEDFKMPGLFLKAPMLGIRYYGYRRIHKGDSLWVRHDLTVPDQYDVEVEFKQGPEDRRQLPKDDQVFKLTAYQFFLIKDKLKPMRWTGVDTGGADKPLKSKWKRRKKRNKE